MVVVHRGQIVAERYHGALGSFVSDPTPVTAEVPLLSWSMAKTMLCIVVGMAIAGTYRSNLRSPNQSTFSMLKDFLFGVSFGALMLHIARQGDGAITVDRFAFPFVMISVAAFMAVPVYLGLQRDAGADISRSAV